MTAGTTLLGALVAASSAVGASRSRRHKTDTLAAFLRSLAPDELALGVAYLAGVVPQGRTGIGCALLRDARPSAHAAAPALTLHDVDAAIACLAATTGAGSASARRLQMAALLTRATRDEADFLARLFAGELRQGALAGQMIEAVAAAAALPPAAVRRAAMLGGGVVAIAACALSDGAAGLARFRATLFQPLAPMLAQPADDLADALARIPDAALEWKLDGARVQAHKDGEVVRLYSRTGNDVTGAAPEVAAVVRRADARRLVLDGEAIAIRPGGAPHPFQETMTRFGRVHDVAAMQPAMPRSVFFFDCLHRDGDDLMHLPGSARRAVLERVLPAGCLVPRVVARDAAAAQAFHDDARARGHEGVMVKARDAPYEPGARSAAWRKVKRSHTLDLVVLAAEWGHGRRHGRLSNLHLGAWDPQAGAFVMLGKTPARRDPSRTVSRASSSRVCHASERALRESGWNITQAAKLLGVIRNTLRYRIEKLGLARP